MNDQEQTRPTEHMGIPKAAEIVLSLFPEIDPIQDLDLHAVMTYLASVIKRAKKGNSDAAREVYWIAMKATKELQSIVERHSGILHGLPLTDAPVIMGRNGIANEKDITAQAAIFGVKWERKMRKDANPEIRKLGEKIAAELNRQRLLGADDSPQDSDVPISKILSEKGWRPGKGAPLWKGWKHAAQFLPSPSKNKAVTGQWWEVAEACLQKHYPTEGGKWFQHPEILKLAGKANRADEIDTDEARGTVRKAIYDRFIEAVDRLQSKAA